MMTYRESCNYRVSMWSVNRIVDSFCSFMCKVRDSGKVAFDAAERNIDAAVDVALAFEDHKATAETYAAFAKIREFNRRHNLAY